MNQELMNAIYRYTREHVDGRGYRCDFTSRILAIYSEYLREHTDQFEVSKAVYNLSQEVREDRVRFKHRGHRCELHYDDCGVGYWRIYVPDGEWFTVDSDMDEAAKHAVDAMIAREIGPI